MITDILFSKRTIIGAIGYLLYAIVCTQLSLFNTLGYEFAGLTGIFVACASVLIISPQIKVEIKEGEIVRLYYNLVFVQLILLFIPFIVLVLNAYFVRNCSLLTGALFYVLIPCLTLLFTTSLSLVLSRLFKRFLLTSYYVVILILLLYPILIILTQPQLYAYNHLFGMFIGFSWDESQPPFPTLILFRITTVAYSFLMICVCSVLVYRGKYFLAKKSEKRGIFVVTAISVVTILLGILFSNELGFSTSSQYVQQTLGSSYRTKHFIIYYSSSSFSKDEIIHVGDEHEFRLYQVTRDLQVDFIRQIKSYIYPSRKVKRKLLGSETSEISRPWMNEIHLSSDYWDTSLKHELVHIVAGTFAPYLIKAPVIHYLGLTEGLAMAFENNYGMRSLHQHAAAMKEYHFLPDVKSFITTQGFWDNDAQLSYVASGSFCQWLIEAFGINKIKKAYLHDDIESIYQQTIDSLQSQWLIYLNHVHRLEPDSLATLFSFKGQPIFRKVCARVLTEMNRSASTAKREGRLQDALNLYNQSETMSPNTSAVYGMILCEYALGRYDSVMTITSRYFAEPDRHYSLLPLYLWRGDAAWMQGNYSEAEFCYRFIRDQNLDQSETNEAALKLATLHSPNARDRMWKILSTRMTNKSDDNSIRYTHIKELENILRMDSSFFPARFLLAMYLSTDTTKIREAIQLLNIDDYNNPMYLRMKRTLGSLLLKLKLYETAKTEYESLLNTHLIKQQKDFLLDQIDRCEWMKKMNR